MTALATLRDRTHDTRAAGPRRVAVVGGGVMGLTLAHRLVQAGHHVSLHEAGPTLGGLASAVDVAGRRVDRFYHAVLSSDRAVLDLAAELGIGQRVRWGTARMAFFHEGALHPMSTAGEFLRFAPLSLLDRARLGWTVAAARAVGDWRRLDDVPLERWLTRHSGRRVYEHVWRPLLASKFDGQEARVPATYIWSRIRRMTSTRKGSAQREAMGCFEGGYETLADALAGALRQGGAELAVGSKVERLVVRGGRVSGLVTGGREQRFDAVVSTLPDPVLARLLPPGQGEFARELAAAPYLGIACLLLVLDRALSPYHTLHLTDRSVPLTAVVETTALTGPHEGAHLVYLPRYLSAGNPLLLRGDDEVRQEFTEALRRIFPAFRPSWVLGHHLGRARFVEPLHWTARGRILPGARTALPGLFVANTRRIYPALHNCEAVVRHAEQAAREVLAEVPAGEVPA